MPKFGKSFSFSKLFRRGASARSAPADPMAGFSDPMLDIGWVTQAFNLSGAVEAARYQACYFAAWMHVDTPELLSSSDRATFSDSANQLDPSSPQGAGVVAMSDMTMSASISPDAAEHLKKYYALLSVVRSASMSQTRGTVPLVWSSMLAACGRDAQQAEDIAIALNQRGVPLVIEAFLRHFVGFGADRQSGGSILIPTGSSYELRTVVM